MKKQVILLVLMMGIILPIASQTKVKNVIFLIGDGMGFNHVHAAWKMADTTLNMQRAHAVGIVETFSADKYVTDSGAGGTALASGIKTRNGMIGMCPDSIPVLSILHKAQQNKLSTGVVATSSITHATPASFVAHQVNRKMEEEIAYDIYQSNIDIFIGGGSKFFMQRSDDKNLVDSLKNKGYGIYFTLNEAIQSPSRKKGVLLASNELPSMQDGRGNMLAEATQLAIDVLSKNKKGFFLMVEGSQIDWAGHGNNFEGIVQETLDFDKAVGIAMDFADKNKNTLVIIASDHETGGLQIIGKNKITNELDVVFNSDYHTPVPVPIFAYGKGADNFSAYLDNTDIKKILMKLYRFK